MTAKKVSRKMPAKKVRRYTWGGEARADGGAFMPPLIFLVLFASRQKEQIIC